MSKSVEEVSKLTESTYKVGTGQNTTGVEMAKWLHRAQIPVSPNWNQFNFACDWKQLSKRQQVFPMKLILKPWSVKSDEMGR